MSSGGHDRPVKSKPQKCKYCGKVLADNELRCTNCGAGR